jgi:hypothetical protein
MQNLKMPGLKTLAVETKKIASGLDILRDFIPGRIFYKTISQFKMDSKQRQNKIWY